MTDLSAANRAVTSERRRTARGLALANPGAQAHRPILHALASPPTITPGTSGSGTAISNSVVVGPTNAAFTYFGCPVDFGSGTPNNAYYSPSNIAASNGSLSLYTAGSWGVEFEFDGQAFELFIKGSTGAGRYRLTVLHQDGSTDTGWDAANGRLDVSNDGAQWLIKYDFGSAANRRLRFDFGPNLYFRGLRIGPTDTVWKTSLPLGPKVIVLGDSFGEGTGANASFLSYVQTLGILRGWRNIRSSSWGSTGWLADSSGSRLPLSGRLQKDAINWSPDIAIFCVGLNDETLFSQSAIQAAVSSTLATFRAACPLCAVIVAGPFSPSGSPTAQRIQTRDAIKAGGAATVNGRVNADLFVDPIGGTYPYDGTAAHYLNTGYVTGTGKTTATTGSGNADRYTGSDGTHPTQAGHDHLGRRLAADIAAGLPL